MSKSNTITYTSADVAKLGTDVALLATQHVASAGNAWDVTRTAYVAAQSVNKARAFIEDFRNAGNAVPGKKASWFRAYLCVLAGAAEHGVTITDAMGMTAAQKLVKEAKDNAKPLDAKQAALLVMFERIAQGCLNAGVTKAALAKSLKALEA